MLFQSPLLLFFFLRLPSLDTIVFWLATYTRVVRTGMPRAHGGRSNQALIRLPFFFIILGTVGLGGLNATRLSPTSTQRLIKFCVGNLNILCSYLMLCYFAFSGHTKSKRRLILHIIHFSLDDILGWNSFQNYTKYSLFQHQIVFTVDFMHHSLIWHVQVSVVPYCYYLTGKVIEYSLLFVGAFVFFKLISPQYLGGQGSIILIYQTTKLLKGLKFSYL